MTREYDHNRPVNLARPALDVARDRARRFPDPLDQARFMDAFAQARVATARGDDRLYLWLRAALDHDDSVRVAGLIEGSASLGDRKGLVF